jgi:hypothetical protein
MANSLLYFQKTWVLRSKNAQNTVKENLLDFFECVFWIFQPKLPLERSFLKNLKNFSTRPYFGPPFKLFYLIRF